MTFSLIAYDKETESLGSVVASKWTTAGSCVLYFRPGVGVVHSQNRASPALAESCLDLMQKGTSLADSFNLSLLKDRAAERRQCILANFSGQFHIHNDGKYKNESHALLAESCAAAGNALLGKAVIEDMVLAYQSSVDLPFPERLLLALEAGEAKGGDRRGQEAAALRIYQKSYPVQDYLPLDLRVDSSKTAIKELRSLYKRFLAVDRSVI